MARAEGATASIELSLRSSREAGAVYRSLKPEEDLPGPARCKASVSRRGNVLYLKIEAAETAALRAAVNSFLRWAAVARDMIKVDK